MMLSKSMNDLYSAMRVYFYMQIYSKFETKEATLTAVESFSMECIFLPQKNWSIDGTGTVSVEVYITCLCILMSSAGRALRLDWNKEKQKSSGS